VIAINPPHPWSLRKAWIHVLLSGVLLNVHCEHHLHGQDPGDLATVKQTRIGKPQQEFLKSYCIDCHERGNAEGNLVLSGEFIDWSLPESIAKWEKVHQMLSKQVMPPSDADQPAKDRRRLMTNWLDTQLVQHSPIGGTPLRRLCAREYRNTIANILQLPEFVLPNNFPPDSTSHGFDNQGENLVVAGSHLEALAETATLIADQFFLQPATPPASSERTILPDGLTISYSSACLIDGTMRLASSGTNLRRNATWPSRFAAPATGKYRVELTASTSDNAPIPSELEISSMVDVTSKSTVQTTINIQPGEPQTIEFEVQLERGQTFTLRYASGLLDYENKNAYRSLLTQLFAKEPRLAAAWNTVGNPARGGSGWARVVEASKRPDLDVKPFIENEQKRLAVVENMVSNSVKSGETLVYRYFEEGPYLGIHQLKITGPTEILPDKNEVRRRAMHAKLTQGLSSTSSQADIESFFAPLLTKLFRRQVTDRELTSYVNLAQQERERTKSLDRGLHLAIRTALISPAFLYRSIGPGQLTDNELASRLSYFLQSGPPDKKLRELADQGKLRTPSVLASEVRRLYTTPAFTIDFTHQWLGLDALEHLMPDSRLIKNFKPTFHVAMQKEVQLTFQHVLKQNLPVHDLVTPDFLFTNEQIGWELYGMSEFEPPAKGKKPKFKKGMRLIGVERDGKRGGLLSMPAVMMATANGVDTQPVLRGVWVLENILGSPPPDPPNAVPALTPDTRGTNTPKERLAAHMDSQSCAVCHREIDPLGFVLENFDPIGRWRDHYPRYLDNDGKSERVDGPEIDPSGTLPTGESLADIRDLKRWLMDNPEPFARCVSEKLLTYATGRRLNYRERTIIAEIVETQAENEYRFRDLLLALINSEIFRTK
jgi:hypothetical protein